MNWYPRTALRAVGSENIYIITLNHYTIYTSMHYQEINVSCSLLKFYSKDRYSDSVWTDLRVFFIFSSNLHMLTYCSKIITYRYIFDILLMICLYSQNFRTWSSATTGAEGTVCAQTKALYRFRSVLILFSILIGKENKRLILPNNMRTLRKRYSVNRVLAECYEPINQVWSLTSMGDVPVPFIPRVIAYPAQKLVSSQFVWEKSTSSQYRPYYICTVLCLIVRITLIIHMV
jgi:hypothetical protein